MVKRNLDVEELRELVKWSVRDNLHDFRKYLIYVCRSLMHISIRVKDDPDNACSSVELSHLSLRSYLVSEQCPKEFRIFEQNLHSGVVNLCLDILSRRRNEFLHFRRCASHYWVYHLADASQSKQLDYDLLLNVYGFFDSDDYKA